MIMFMAKVFHSEVDGSAVRRRCQHHLRHYSGDVQLLLQLYKVVRLFLSCSLLPSWLFIVEEIFLLKAVGHSVLSLEVFSCTFR